MPTVAIVGRPNVGKSAYLFVSQFSSTARSSTIQPTAKQRTISNNGSSLPSWRTIPGVADGSEIYFELISAGSKTIGMSGGKRKVQDGYESDFHLGIRCNAFETPKDMPTGKGFLVNDATDAGRIQISHKPWFVRRNKRRVCP